MTNTVVHNLPENINQFYGNINNDLDVGQRQGWKSSVAMKQGYKIITNHMKNFEGMRLLDVGCGEGTFFDHFRGSVPVAAYSYVGVDCYEPFIITAKTKLGMLAPKVNFYHSDILLWESERPFDYVVAAGIFNHTYGSMGKSWRSEDIEARVNKMASLAKGPVLLTIDPMVYPPNLLFSYIRNKLLRRITLDYSYRQDDCLVIIGEPW